MIEEFSGLLRETIGLDPASIGQSSIDRAVRQRIGICGVADPSAYLQHVRGTPGELQALVEAVVVPETWFFRDPKAFPVVIEQARQASPQERQRFLCLPCSTGEEPYSLAMALLDAGIPPERFSIDAMDISERALSVARAGIYGRNSFRGRDIAFRDTYFEQTPAGFVLAPHVRKLVQFHQGNLLDDVAMARGRSYDAIFCRNLLIYFDSETQGRAISTFERLLLPDGLFFVGPAETRAVSAYNFTHTRIALAFAFRKGKPQAAPTPQPAGGRRSVGASGPGGPPGGRRAGGAGEREAARAPANAALPPQAPTARCTPAGPPPKLRPLPKPIAEPQRPVEPAASLAEAMRLANEGRFHQVAALCHAALAECGPSTDAFYLLGLVSDAEGRMEEAAEHYRKALYLNPQHHDTLLHYSLLAAKRGDTMAAQVLRERAGRCREEAA